MSAQPLLVSRMPGSGPKENIPELNAISRRGWWSEIRYQVQQWQDALHGEKHRLYQTSREASWTPWSLDCERTVGLWPCWKRPPAGSSFNEVHPRANGAHLEGLERIKRKNEIWWSLRSFIVTKDRRKTVARVHVQHTLIPSRAGVLCPRQD